MKYKFIVLKDEYSQGNNPLLELRHIKGSLDIRKKLTQDPDDDSDGIISVWINKVKPSKKNSNLFLLEAGTLYQNTNYTHVFLALENGLRNTRYTLIARNHASGVGWVQLSKKKYDFHNSDFDEPDTELSLLLKTELKIDSSVIQTIAKAAPWQLLPLALAESVADFLRGRDFFITCHLFNNVTKKSTYWKRIIQQDFPRMISLSELTKYKPDQWKDLYIILFGFLMLVAPNTPLKTKEQYDQKAKSILDRIQTLKEKTNQSLDTRDWVRFIMGNFYYQGFHFNQNFFTACLFFKAAVDSHPPFILAAPMWAYTNGQLFEELKTSPLPTDPNQSKIRQLNLYKLAFYLTHDPVIAFYLGTFLGDQLNKATIVDEKEKLTHQAIEWFEKSLELGLQNHGQQPTTDKSRKLKALMFLAQYKYKNNFSQQCFEFYQKYYSYILIISQLNAFAKQKLVASRDKNIVVAEWMKVMRETKDPTERAARADGLLEYLSPPKKLKDLSDHSYLNIKLLVNWTQECKTILNESKTDIFRHNPFRLTGQFNKKYPEKLIHKNDIDLVLDKIIKRQIQLKKPIEWKIIEIDNEPCAKMNLQVKQENQLWFHENLQNFKISFMQEEGQSYFHLVIHNVDPQTFNQNIAYSNTINC